MQHKGWCRGFQRRCCLNLCSLHTCSPVVLIISTEHRMRDKLSIFSIRKIEKLVEPACRKQTYQKGKQGIPIPSLLGVNRAGSFRLAVLSAGKVADSRRPCFAQASVLRIFRDFLKIRIQTLGSFWIWIHLMIRFKTSDLNGVL